MDSTAYNLREYEIACTRNHPGRCLPPIGPQHERVLDVGCGAGQTLAAAGLKPGVQASGVDPDGGAITLGRRLWPQLDLREGRGESLPFADRSFDLVACRVALPYMDVPRAVAEMVRVLRPGGDLWLVLHTWTMWRKRVLGALRKGDLGDLALQSYVLFNSLSLHLSGRTFAMPVRRGYESVQTETGIRRVLTNAGLENVEIQRGRHFVVTARKP